MGRSSGPGSRQSAARPDSESGQSAVLAVLLSGPSGPAPVATSCRTCGESDGRGGHLGMAGVRCEDRAGSNARVHDSSWVRMPWFAVYGKKQ